MSDSILVDVDLEPAKNTAAMKQKVNLQHCDSSEGKCRVTKTSSSQIFALIMLFLCV